jgi:hypothetical protein
MFEIRLGDIIDDYCVKCKRIMNHAVVSMLNGEPAKVRCRTCHNDHDYRHEQPPPPKVDSRKQALFNEVLAKVTPVPAVTPAAADTDTDADTDTELDPVLEAVLDPVPDEPEEPAPPPEVKPKKAKPAAKAKAKAKAKGHK